MNSAFEKALKRHRTWIESDGKDGEQLVLKSSIPLGNYWTDDNRCVFVPELGNQQSGLSIDVLDNELLAGIDLGGVNFMGYSFKNRDLSQCTFRKSILTSCSFSNCELADVSLDMANISNSLFSSCLMRNASFDETALRGCIFDECHFDSCRFVSSDFRNAWFKRVKISESELLRINFEETHWEKTLIDRSRISESNSRASEFDQMEIVECSIQGLNLDRAQKGILKLCNSSGIGIKWRRSLIERLNIESSKFPSSDFSGSKISELEISDSDLSYSRFTDLYEYTKVWNSKEQRYDEKVDKTDIEVGKCFITRSHLLGVNIESTLLHAFLENDTCRRYRGSFVVMKKDSKVYPFRVFICHAHEDVEIAKSVFDYLSAESDISPWLDKLSLLPGQDWKREIRKAIEEADSIVILCSPSSMRKRGYVQREFKLALDVLNEFPPGEIFIIPLRIAEVEITDDLKAFQWIDYNGEEAMLAIARAIRTKPRSRVIISESEQDAAGDD